MSKGYERIKSCIDCIRKKTDFKPEVALVLGSGLGEYGNNLEIEAEINYKDLPDFPVSTVSGHEGKFLFAYIEKVPVVIMKGRVHYYEGYSMEDVVLPIRMMGLLGAEILILTNAAGGVNLSFKPGDFCVITDHISLAIPNPLRGENLTELGPRFPDMSNLYDRKLREEISNVGKELGIPLKEGIYMQCMGPSYETPAEIRALRNLGVDAVGMSTVCEAIAAGHMGMRVSGISCITNMAAGILEQPLNHEEVQEVANRVKKSFEKLITEIIKKTTEAK